MRLILETWWYILILNWIKSLIIIHIDQYLNANTKRSMQIQIMDRASQFQTAISLFLSLFWIPTSIWRNHYGDVIMGGIASQITSLTIVYSTVYSDADQRKHQSSASLTFVRRIHRWPMNSPLKGPVTRKMFPLHEIIILTARNNPIWLTHLPLVPHVFVSESGQHWFR